MKNRREERENRSAFEYEDQRLKNYFVAEDGTRSNLLRCDI